MTDNECRDGDAISANAFSRKVMAEFKQALRENLTDDPTQTGKFRAQFGDIRHIFEWQQVEPLSAMGKFVVRGKTAAASFYYHGFPPDLDEAVLEATEALFVNWFGEKSQAACCGLRSVKERPVAIVMPASKEVLSPADWQIIGNLCPCLAAVFFNRAEAAIKAIETYWHNRGFRKGGTEDDFIWN